MIKAYIGCYVYIQDHRLNEMGGGAALKIYLTIPPSTSSAGGSHTLRVTSDLNPRPEATILY